MKIRSVRIHEYSETPKLTIEELELGEPGPDEVLVEVEAFPINPSDVLFSRGFEFRRDLPATVGFEGCGTVLRAGKDFQHLVGKRVSFTGMGTWSTHILTSGVRCIQIQKDVPVGSACSGNVNPLTVLGFYDYFKKRGHKGIVHTAGASALGKMLIRFCRIKNIPLLNLVRKKEYVEVLKKQGAQHVLVMEGDWLKELTSLAEKYTLDCCFEAIGGQAFANIFKAMPAGSTTYLYGFLSFDHHANISLPEMFRNKKIDGFLLFNWFPTLTKEEIFQIHKEHSGLLKGPLATSETTEYKLEQVVDAFNNYRASPTGNKSIVKIK